MTLFTCVPNMIRARSPTDVPLHSARDQLGFSLKQRLPGNFAPVSATISVIALLLGSTAVSAQITPPSRDQLAPPQAREDDRNGPTLTIDGEMERGPCALDDPRFADIRLTLSDVSFVGMEKAPDVSLLPAYQAYVGKDLPLAVLCDIRAQARQILLKEGYLATVEIPEQRLADGKAEFRVVFGRVTAIRVRGEAGPSEAMIARYLEKLTEQEVFNTRDAERYLLLADDLPGVDVRLSLRAAADGAPGELVGEVAVLRRRGAIDSNVQNFGSKALGRFGGLLRGEIYDLTGMGDRTSLSIFSTADVSEQKTFQLGHDFRIGSEGTMLGGQFTYSTTNPDIGLAGFDVKSETYFATLQSVRPLIRRQTTSLYLTGGFDFANQDVKINGVPLSKDRVRMGFTRLDYTSIDRESVSRVGGYTPFEPRTRFSANLELRSGYNVFKASPDCRPNLLACTNGGAVPPSRIEADPTPRLLRFGADGEFRPVPNIAFILKADGQFTRDPLPAFEEFAGGNYSIGRGYDPGAVLGDSGLGLSAEMRFGSLAPKNAKSFAWQPFIFTDALWAWNEDPSRRAGNPDRLWSAGGGVRFSYGAAMQGGLTVAVPLQRPDLQLQRGDVRVLLSITTRLLPWRY